MRWKDSWQEQNWIWQKQKEKEDNIDFVGLCDQTREGFWLQS
jgi:hypothetical protein